MCHTIWNLSTDGMLVKRNNSIKSKLLNVNNLNVDNMSWHLESVFWWNA